MRTEQMTLTTLATLLLLAGTAHASQSWEGTWKTDKDEKRALLRSGALLAFDVVFADVDARTFHLVGAPAGHRLHLEGRLDATPGITGALGGEKPSGRKHTVALDGDLDEATSTATVHIKVDGGERAVEKWSRGGLEIVSLESDGSALTGALDVKKSRSGLVVKYRVNGSALRITASVRPATGHPCPSFYEGPVMTRELGTVEPGDRSFTWDGRDTTSARRIALGGPYVIVLEAGTVSTKADLTVEAARFEAIGSDWPEMNDPVLGRRPAWNPKPHLELVATLLLTGPAPGSGAFGFPGTRLVKSAAEVRQYAATAASILISTHGNVGILAVRGDHATQTYTPSEIFHRDLKDVHFAFVSACYSGAGKDGSTVADQLIASGCDVVVGFNGEADLKEADDYEAGTLALLARGCPIEKAARDASHGLDRNTYSRGMCRPIPAEGMIVVRRASGIDETETLWPPRYGRSTN